VSEQIVAFKELSGVVEEVGVVFEEGLAVAFEVGVDTSVLCS